MNNLNLPQVASNQNQKEVTINEQAMALDAAFSEALIVDLGSDDASLSQEQFTRNFTFILENAAVARTLTVYATKRLFAVRNTGSADVTVTIGAGESVTVPAGNAAVLLSDGANIIVASAGAATGFPDVPDDGAFYIRAFNAWLKLVEGSNITFDASEPGELKIKAAGGGGGGGIADAPDGDPHVRVAGEWLKLIPGDGVTFDDSAEGELIVEASGDGGSGEPRAIMPDAGFTGSYNGNFATVANAVVFADDVKVNAIYGAFNAPASAEYHAAIFEISSSGAIQSTVASTSAYSPESTGIQDHIFPVSPKVTLEKDKIYAIALIRTDGTSTSPCYPVNTTSGAARYSGARLSIPGSINSLSSMHRSFWYAQNDPEPESGSASGSTTGGGFAIGLFSEPPQTGGGSESEFLRVLASFSGNDTGSYATLANQFTLSRDRKLTGVFAAFNAPSGAKYCGCVFEVDGSGKIIASVAASGEYTPDSTGLQEHLFSISPAIDLAKDTTYIMALVRTDGAGSAKCQAAAITSGTLSYSDQLASMDSYFGNPITRRWYANNDPYAVDVSQASSAGNGAYGIGLIFE